MSFKRTTIECPCCKKSFYTEYYHGGSIEHENSYRNMHVFVNRFDSGWNKDELFMCAINLDGNHCSIKDNTIKVGREIFNCVLIWLRQNNRDDIYKYLKDKDGEIAGKYNDVRQVVIDNLRKQIEEEEAKLVR